MWCGNSTLEVEAGKSIPGMNDAQNDYPSSNIAVAIAYHGNRRKESA